MMKPPTFIQVCLSGAWGGLEMSTVKITHMLHEKGYRSLALCAKDSPLHHELQRLGLPFAPVAGVRPYFAPGLVRQIRRILQQEQPRSVFLHQTRDLWHLRFALLGLQQIRLYCFARMFFRDVNKRDFLHRWVYKRLNQMICLSTSQIEAFTPCLPLEHTKYCVIPNGIDGEKFQPRPPKGHLRSQLGLQKTDILIGLVGRLDRQKGQKELIEAASLLRDKYPHIKYVCVGEATANQTEYESLLRSMVADLNLKNDFHLIGHDKEIHKIFNELDIFVMPSYEEAFGNVMVEALASGLPCIGTNSGGVPDILDYGKAGLLVEPRSGPSLAEGIEQFIQSEELRQKFASHARDYALKRFDKEWVYSEIEKLALNESPVN